MNRGIGNWKLISSDGIHPSFKGVAQLENDISDYILTSPLQSIERYRYKY